MLATPYPETLNTERGSLWTSPAIVSVVFGVISLLALGMIKSGYKLRH